MTTKFKPSDITYVEHLGYLKIYWYKILYLAINMETFTGLNSWKYKGTYSIELYTNNQKILLQFDTAERWKTILAIFNEIL